MGVTPLHKPWIPLWCPCGGAVERWRWNGWIKGRHHRGTRAAAPSPAHTQLHLKSNYFQLKFTKHCLLQVSVPVFALSIDIHVLTSAPTSASGSVSVTIVLALALLLFLSLSLAISLRLSLNLPLSLPALALLFFLSLSFISASTSVAACSGSISGSVYVPVSIFYLCIYCTFASAYLFLTLKLTLNTTLRLMPLNQSKSLTLLLALFLALVQSPEHRNQTISRKGANIISRRPSHGHLARRCCPQAFLRIFSEVTNIRTVGKFYFVKNLYITKPCHHHRYM
jgi:hypothetical protein